MLELRAAVVSVVDVVAVTTASFGDDSLRAARCDALGEKSRHVGYFSGDVPVPGLADFPVMRPDGRTFLSPAHACQCIVIRTIWVSRSADAGREMENFRHGTRR